MHQLVDYFTGISGLQGELAYLVLRVSFNCSCFHLCALFHLLNTKQINQVKMIKGIQGPGYYNELVVPIIETWPTNMCSQSLLPEQYVPFL